MVYLVFHAVSISSAIGALVALAAMVRVLRWPPLTPLLLAFLSQLLSYIVGVVLTSSIAQFPVLGTDAAERSLLTLKFILSGCVVFWFPVAARGLLAVPPTPVFRAILGSFVASSAVVGVLIWFHPGIADQAVLLVVGAFTLLTYGSSLTYTVILPLRLPQRIAPRYRRPVRALSVLFLVLVEAMIVEEVAIILGAPLTQRLLDGVTFFGLSIAILVMSIDVLLSRARAAGLPGWQEFGRDRGLTDRELDVLGALVKGESYKEIARRLSISPDTVKTHVGRVYRKSGVVSRSQLRYLCRPDSSPQSSG